MGPKTHKEERGGRWSGLRQFCEDPALFCAGSNSGAYPSGEGIAGALRRPPSRTRETERGRGPPWSVSVLQVEFVLFCAGSLVYSRVAVPVVVVTVFPKDHRERESCAAGSGSRHWCPGFLCGCCC